MRCPSCNKFATYDTSTEPEVDLEVSSEVSEEGIVGVQVTGTVRIVLTAECCGDELKEASFDVNETDEMERAEGCDCDLTNLEVESGGFDLTDERQATTSLTKKDGTVTRRAIPPRFQKQYYGAEGDINVRCGCGKSTLQVRFADRCQASGMDELV